MLIVSRGCARGECEYLPMVYDPGKETQRMWPVKSVKWSWMGDALIQSLVVVHMLMLIKRVLTLLNYYTMSFDEGANYLRDFFYKAVSISFVLKEHNFPSGAWESCVRDSFLKVFQSSHIIDMMAKRLEINKSWGQNWIIDESQGIRIIFFITISITYVFCCQKSTSDSKEDLWSFKMFDAQSSCAIEVPRTFSDITHRTRILLRFYKTVLEV